MINTAAQREGAGVGVASWGEGHGVGQQLHSGSVLRQNNCNTAPRVQLLAQNSKAQYGWTLLPLAEGPAPPASLHTHSLPPSNTPVAAASKGATGPQATVSTSRCATRPDRIAISPLPRNTAWLNTPPSQSELNPLCGARRGGGVCEGVWGGGACWAGWVHMVGREC